MLEPLFYRRSDGMLFHRVAEKASLIGCTDDLVAAVVARQPKVGEFQGSEIIYVIKSAL